MSQKNAPRQIPMSTPPLSWPPPGMERLQGVLWRVVLLSWTGSVILVLPLLWSLAVEQPFYSLGPFEDNWQLGLSIAAVGAVLIVFAFGHLWLMVRGAANAAEMGYGTLTILEVACDSGRDTGFLIQGKRHFAGLDTDHQVSVVKRRLSAGVLLLAGAVWLLFGFGIAILLAARGFVTPSGIWLITVAPAAALAVLGSFFFVAQNSVVREMQTEWSAQEGANRIHTEAEAWNANLDQAGDDIALGPGARGEAGRFRLGATVVVVLFIVGFGPTVTIALTTAIGPILAEIAVPTFLAVQEAAGGAEVLRRFDLEKDPSISASAAGSALQNLTFVGLSGSGEPMEAEPARRYPDPWFTSASLASGNAEAAARDLLSRPFEDFPADEQAVLRAAAAHPAQAEFELLARAPMIDVVSGRLQLPLPDTLTFEDLPWPRFQEMRGAALAHLAKAAVEVTDEETAAAEETIRELIAIGFLLIDQGPTLLDNLIGVELTRIGGNALEGYYQRIGQPDRAESLAWAREGSLGAARKARAGLIPEDARALLQGVPDLVENEDALRGLRWEYFATFHMLAPCINLQKMVFGQDDTYEEWRRRAERTIVRTPGEQELFDLAEAGVLNAGGAELDGFFPRFLSLVLGRSGAPGSCASLITSLQS